MFFPEFIQFNSVQLLSHVRLFATPWITALQASLSISNSRSLLKLMPIKSVMPSSHLILCRPLLLLPSIPPSIRVFSNESALRVTWPKYWSFSFSISPSNEHPEFIREKQNSTFPSDPWPQQRCLVNSKNVLFLNCQRLSLHPVCKSSPWQCLKDCVSPSTHMALWQFTLSLTSCYFIWVPSRLSQLPACSVCLKNKSNFEFTAEEMVRNWLLRRINFLMIFLAAWKSAHKVSRCMQISFPGR